MGHLDTINAFERRYKEFVYRHGREIDGFPRPRKAVREMRSSCFPCRTSTCSILGHQSEQALP
jgi:hypothetical protein